ncbi:ABC transporter permease [Dyadobacter fanqingshengii]|uniref:ABC transporter permease n=1 Tax=Dyadobacter fanqingshengii TaxID=2906443 RepID=A0A9X1T8X7_9BACT|nr:ABC transporter permease [Dyadobacter fanqingshengii]MCF0039349.1 ABC transporter permease [Dyadobacter fanqingshengii]USJ33836.1 ABC transporter permease [Dyadobacter fanqingshengii]
MLKNYFKIAVRNLWKYKTNSIISTIGLAMGIGCFLLLATFVLHETRYDRFQVNADHIVRVNFSYQSGDSEPVQVAVTPTGVAPAFAREFGEIKDAVRLYPYSAGGAVAMKYNDKLFNEKKVLFADESFFRIFPTQFIEGDQATALAQPNSVVIDETTARKYFGGESAIGKSVTMNEKLIMQVTGVIADVPSYSHIKFNWLGSYSTLPRSKTEAFDSANDYTYLLLQPQAKVETLQAKVDQFAAKNLNNPQDPSSKIKLELEAFNRIHLHSKVSAGLEASGNYKYVYILSGVALLILVIACINFVNLVTARSAVRAREVGVRKVMGAARIQVFRQYLFECGLITIAATIVGLLISLLGFPIISNITETALGLRIWPAYSVILLLIALAISVTLLSGIYPAAVLSRFEPIKVLKGKVLAANSGSGLRSTLVVFQFTISILFIIGTIIANQQLHYIQNKGLGLGASQIIVMDVGSGISAGKLASMKNELLNNPIVKYVTASYDSPINVQGGYTISASDKPQDFQMNITAIPVEKDFVPTLGMRLIAGQNFNDTDILQATTDSVALRKYAFILNESAVKALGWTAETAVGKMVNMNGREGAVKAVAQDFHFRSLHEKIGPIAIIPEYSYFGKVMVKVSGNESGQAVDLLRQRWKDNFPMRPFEYHFLDQEFDEMYKAETRVSAILGLFSGIAIFISCLGLFALIAFISEQRTKEIGVRKVLGASVASIVMLLSKDFVKMILVAIAIATPAAWYGMNKWLSDFAYQIKISPWIFIIVGLAAIAIALFTISFQSIKAALMNPVKSLKSE